MVEVSSGGNHLYIHTQGVHVSDSSIRCPLFFGVNIRFLTVNRQSMPVFAGIHSTQETLGVRVGVNVYRPRGCSPEMKCLALRPVNGYSCSRNSWTQADMGSLS